MNLTAFKKQLAEFISFKSISTDPLYKPEIQKTTDWLKSTFETNGFEVDIWNGPNSNPIVCAKYEVSPELETVMVYGHYDVQPADKSDGWFKDPFTVHEANGKLYARGIVDNKGQVFVHMHTVFELIKKDNLKYNVIFLIEGNEETSNEDIGNLVLENKDNLQVDYIMVSDGELTGENPAIEYALRGGFNCKIVYKTALNNLHSGIYGGVVPNPVVELSKFLNGIFNDDGSIALDFFYTDVDKPSAQELTSNKKVPLTVESVKEVTGVKKVFSESNYDLATQIGLRPTIQPTGIIAGYVGEGYANIIPSSAEVRINFRTVCSQDSKRILEQFNDYVLNNSPEYVDVEFSHSNTYEAIKIDISSPKVKEVSELLAKAYGVPTLQKPVGGGIPVVTDFKEVLGIDTLLVPFGNDDCNMHGVNENFTIDLLEKALAFSKLFFSKN